MMDLPTSGIEYLYFLMNTREVCNKQKGAVILLYVCFDRLADIQPHFGRQKSQLSEFVNELCHAIQTVVGETHVLVR